MRKTKRQLALGLIFSMICLLFAGCGGTATKIELQNLLDHDVYELYISSADAEEWGESVLGSDVFSENQTIQFEVDVKNAPNWDIHAVDSDGDFYFFYDVPMANGTAVQLVSKNEGCTVVVIPKKGAPLTIDGKFELGESGAPEEVPAPTQDDPLDLSIAMPGFESLLIPYPSTMEVTKQNDRFLHFEAVNDPNCKEAVIFDLVQLGGTYEQRLQGASTVQPALSEIVEKITNIQFPEQVIKSIGEDYIDGGNYYSIISYLWLSGSVFTEGSDIPVRGVVECRYYGPTGYILVAITLADEGAVQRYFKIAQKTLDNVSFGIEWQTPKETDVKWVAPDGYDDYDPWSDPGDYGYYYDDYDPWSDPGDYGYDYDDYDPWSDPGDYGYDYEDDYYDDYYEPNDYDF